MKFLVVDDITFDRNIIESCVKKLGFSVDSAANGEEMFKICQKNMPDCVILDWEMGETTGIALLNKLRAMEGGENTKVLICTSNNHPSFIGHAHAQGADGFVSKPISSEKLAEKLREIGVL
jgi:two-component system chemotaxis response regulator CheY